MTEKIRFGLIGTGNMGQNHLRVLSMMKTVELVFIYDLDTERSKRLSKKYDVRAETNLADGLKEIDAVVITTPTSTHFDYIKLVSKYVKNIFVEKPLTDSLETSKEIVKLAKDNALKIQVGLIERFNPAVMVLKKVISPNGGYGNNVINVDLTRTNKVSSRITDVDVVLDLMIHDIDLALFLNGPVVDVQSYGVKDNGFISFSKATLKHENGAFSSITASRITEKRIRHIAVTCKDMFVDCNLLSKEVNISKQTVEQYHEEISISSQEQTIAVTPQEALVSELASFVNFIKENETENIPTDETALDAMKIVDKIYNSIDLANTRSD